MRHKITKSKSVFQRGSIRAKMLISILLLTTAEFICVFLVIGTIYRNNNLSKSHADNVRALNNIASQFSFSREKVNSFMTDMQGDAEFMESIALLWQGDLSYAQNTQLVDKAQKSLRSNLQLKEEMLMVEVHIVGRPDLQIIVQRSNPRGQWQEFEDVYMNRVVAEPGRMLVYVPENSNQLVFSRAQPVIMDRKVLGYYCINVLLSQTRITQILKLNMGDHSRQAILFDDSGSISSRTSGIFDGYDATSLSIVSEESGICSNALGVWVFDRRYIPSMNMSVCVMADMSSIDLTSQSFLGSVRVVLGAMICTTLLIGLLITRWINRPIQSLQRQFGETLSSSTWKPLHISGSDELNHVAEGINSLLERQESLIKDNYRSRLLEKNARIELLQVQINPHFVFNTLDIINWFIYEEKNDEARKALIALGDMMRYSIYKYRSFVSLRDEIHQIQNYLYIQTLRYDNCFSVEIDIEEGLDDTPIPCLTIQPIIENAVKYGVSTRETGGKLTVKASRAGEDLVIVVFDNGPGMSEDKIRKALEPDRDIEQEGGSIGLRNVNERMILLFGESYAIQVESKTGKYTQVTLRLPMEGKSHENHYR